MKIEELAMAAGVGVGTVRAYQGLGLLPVRADYGERDVERVLLIRAARGARVAHWLVEQGAAALGDGGVPLLGLGRAARREAEGLERRIEELRRQADHLREQAERWEAGEATSRMSVLMVILSLNSPKR